MQDIDQVTGCLPLPTSYCCGISLLVCSGSFKCLWAMTMTMIHFCHLGQKCQTGHTLLLFPQECWLLFHQYMWIYTVLVNWVLCLDYMQRGIDGLVLALDFGLHVSIVSLAGTWMLVILPVWVFISYHHASVIHKFVLPHYNRQICRAIF